MTQSLLPIIRALFHLGPASRHAGLPGRPHARFPSAPRCRYDLSRRRHHRRLAARSGWYWPQAHNDIVQKLLRKVRKGARMIYIPGNHDEFARDYVGMTFGGVEVMRRRDPRDRGRHALSRHAWRRVRHRGAARALARLPRRLGLRDRARHQHAISTVVRRKLGFPYWSFSAWAKLKVKNAVNFIGAFEDALSQEALRHEARRRHLRPYPSCGDPRDQRHHLRQHRRLRRILHRRWPNIMTAASKSCAG